MTEENAFHTTRWTLVSKAHGRSPEARDALRELCGAYYPPVVTFLRRDGRDEDAARELAHEFFAHVLAEESLGGAQQVRGRFRSYLLGALKHFLANRRRDALRKKRGGGAEHVALDASADDSPGVAIADSSSRSAVAEFDRDWALAIVERALQFLEAECAAAGQRAHFATLKPWLTPNPSIASQQDAATQLGLSDGAVRVAIHRLRRRFREIVRAEIAQTLHTPAEVDEEMHYLIAALAG